MTSGPKGPPGTPPDPQTSVPGDDSIEAIESGLLRVLIGDPSFRWAAVAMVLLVGSVLLVALPVFVVSPPDIEPPVRASLLEIGRAHV